LLVPLPAKGPVVTGVGPLCVTVSVAVPIVIVPVRLPESVFGCTVYVTVPSPVPEVPPVIVIHDVVVLAVQANPAVAVTETVRPALPPIGAASVVFEMANAYVGVTPACVTVNVCPPIISVPVRLLALVFAATLYVTVPLPVVEAPAVIVSHSAFDVTGTVFPVAPAATAVSVVGVSVTLPASPLCVTMNVCPPTVMVPVREATLPFAV
jgi:hypothetical protein